MANKKNKIKRSRRDQRRLQLQAIENCRANIPRKGNRFTSDKSRDIARDRSDVAHKDSQHDCAGTTFTIPTLVSTPISINKGATRKPNCAGKKQALLKKNPKPEPKAEPEGEPEGACAPPVVEPVVVTGKRSCTLRRCAFKSCANHDPAAETQGGVTYFTFPKNPICSAKWARVIGRAQQEEFRPKLTSVVCSLHFASWQILPDGRGGATVYKSAVPSAEPVPQEETQNIEEVMLPDAVNLNVLPGEDSDALAIKVEPDSSDYELQRAVDSIAELLPPRNGIRIQCVGLDSAENATLHYLSVDKDNTVNHTRVNINKNNIATLNYVDSASKVNHTLKCINLNEDSISTYEELVKPNITDTHTEKKTIKHLEITPDAQNNLGNAYNFKIKQVDADSSSHNNEPPVKPLETVEMKSTDNLSELTKVKSEIFDDGVEIEDIVIETNDPSEILPCDDDIKQELSDSDEVYVVQMEYED